MAMAAVVFSRKIIKECFHRLAVLSSLSAAVGVVPLRLQLIAGSTESFQSVEIYVRKICAPSAWHLQRREAEDVRRGFVDLRDGISGQQRWYARSNSKKAKPDPDSIATEMIKYVASCRSQGKLEHCRVQEPL